MTDRAFAEAQDEAAEIREAEAYPGEYYERLANAGAPVPTTATLVRTLGDTLALIEAQPDVTTHLRNMIARLARPDLNRLAEAVEQHERTIAAQRTEIRRLTKLAALGALGTALARLVPTLEHLVEETKAAHDPGLLR